MEEISACTTRSARAQCSLNKLNYHSIPLKPLFRYVAIFLLLGLLFFLGFLRDGYVVNLHLEGLPLLISRYSEAISLIPAAPWSSGVIDPRWYNLPLFVLLMAGLTLLLARLLFRKRNAVQWAGLVYLGLTGLSGFIIGLGWAMQLPLVYTLGQHLKELLLSPLFSLLLLAALYMGRHLR
jgi:hypothetical protein